MKHEDLYKIDMLSFNTKIGSITNIGTTYYEMLSMYEKGSKEYNEIYIRLKLCCIEQSKTIDSAKGLIVKPFPKHWTDYQKISKEDYELLSSDELDELGAINAFNNKLLVGNKRPYFMRYVYPIRNKEYRSFLSDFNRLSRIYWDCDIEDIPTEEMDSEIYKTFISYYRQKSPLIETDGTMNRVCRHMENEIKEFNNSRKYKKNGKMLELLYNTNTETNLELLPIMEKVYTDYISFKKNKMLSDSRFNNYEQYFKSVKDYCLENISSNENELANLAVYVLYKNHPNKPKDFVWDCFGKGILSNVLLTKDSVWLPLKNDFGNIEYLGSSYSNNMISIKNGEVDIEKVMEMDLDFEFDCLEDVFNLDEDIFDMGF